MEEEQEKEAEAEAEEEEEEEEEGVVEEGKTGVQGKEKSM